MIFYGVMFFGKTTGGGPMFDLSVLFISAYAASDMMNVHDELLVLNGGFLIVTILNFALYGLRLERMYQS